MHLASQPWSRCAVLAILCGCAARPHGRELAKAEPVTEPPSASEAIAEARCSREASCNEVGAGKRYISLTDCRARIWTLGGVALSESECPNGIDDEQLGLCLRDIRLLGCSEPLESLDELPACAASRLCASAE